MITTVLPNRYNPKLIMQKQPNFKHYTRGGQISFHNLRMWDQITKTLLWACLFLWLILTVVLTWWHAPTNTIQHALAYYYTFFLQAIGEKQNFTLTFHGKPYRQTIETILHYPYYTNNARQVLAILTHSTIEALALSSITGLSVACYFIHRGKTQTANQFIRGSRLASHEQVKQQIVEEKLNSDLTLDGFPLIAGSEVQHLLVHGTVGTGKSQLIMKVLDTLRKRGDRVILYDKGCSLIPYYFKPNTDVLLNPFDERCPNWDLWLEAPYDSDFENMADSLIPMHGESDPFWVNAARTVFVSTACRMRNDKDRSIEKLLNLLLADEFSKLELYLKGTPAAPLVSGAIEKTTLSIRSVMTTYLKSLCNLRGLSGQDVPPFSIRDTILNPNHQGWLFISSNGEQHQALKPLISMWLAMASITLLSLPPDRNRRIWFICDEAPSLHKLPLLGETIAEVRKFGGCFLLGMQSYAQLTKVYGQAGAKEIFDLLNTRFFFRSPSAEMARLVSAELGEEDIEESKEHYSYGASSVRDGISLATHRVTRPIVSYPEILELKDLSCFLRLPGNYPITQLDLALTERQSHFKGFIARTMPKEPEWVQALPQDNQEAKSGVKTSPKRKKREKDAEFEV